MQKLQSQERNKKEYEDQDEVHCQNSKKIERWN